MLSDYGQSMKISVESGGDPRGYLDYFRYIGSGYADGNPGDWYMVYKGSHRYDKREMSILLYGIIQECEQLDIVTLPPAEIERLKEMWRAS